MPSLEAARQEVVASVVAMPSPIHIRKPDSVIRADATKPGFKSDIMS